MKEFICLKNENYQIWIDLYDLREVDNFYFFYGDDLIIKGFYSFDNSNTDKILNTHWLIISQMDEKPIKWKCEKVKEEYFIKINGDIYTIDLNNSKQIELFDKLIKIVFNLA